MNLKLLAILTVVCSLGLFSVAFLYEIPIAYVPEGASKIEQIVYHMIFITVEALTFTYLFIHMMMKSKLKLYGNLLNILK